MSSDIKRAPVLKYEYFKKNKELFESCEYLNDLFDTLTKLHSKPGCSQCGSGNIKIRFKYEAGKYLVEKRPVELLKKLPENMIIAHGKKLLRIRDLL